MNIIPWRNRQPETAGSQTRALGHFRGELDRLFDRFFGDVPFGGSSGPLDLGDTPSMLGSGEWMPQVDIAETNDEVVVKAELPGVDPDNIDVSVTDSMLTLSGEKEEATEDREGDFYRVERRFGAFRRRVPLPASIDPDNVHAEYNNGVLTVHLGKKETVRPRRITVGEGSKELPRRRSTAAS